MEKCDIFLVIPQAHREKGKEGQFRGCRSQDQVFLEILHFYHNYDLAQTVPIHLVFLLPLTIIV